MSGLNGQLNAGQELRGPVEDGAGLGERKYRGGEDDHLEEEEGEREGDLRGADEAFRLQQPIEEVDVGGDVHGEADQEDPGPELTADGPHDDGHLGVLHQEVMEGGEQFAAAEVLWRS